MEEPNEAQQLVGYRSVESSHQFSVCTVGSLSNSDGFLDYACRLHLELSLVGEKGAGKLPLLWPSRRIYRRRRCSRARPVAVQQEHIISVSPSSFFNC